MILYFTGTGNSLAVSRKIAEATGDNVMALREAAGKDLTGEELVGLVYPCYDFNTPPAVREFVSQLNINPKAYVFIIVTCGAQTGNSVWTVRRILKKSGVEVAYCHKIRMPDNSATVFGRNPNDQAWKFEKYAPRLERIVDDIKNRRQGSHFGAPGFAGWFCGLPSMERRLLGAFQPAANVDRCVGCGLCARICPMGNITVDEKASVGNRCTSCLACLHVCPHQAIEVRGKAVSKERQYHHPDVDLTLNMQSKSDDDRSTC